MADQTAEVQTRGSQTENVVTFGGNPFSDEAWSADAPDKSTSNPGSENSESQQQQQTVAETTQSQTQQSQEQQQSSTPPSPDDHLEWLKKLGFDDRDSAERAIGELRQKAQAVPEAPKWANDESRLFYESWAAGKEDEVFEMLSLKRKIERAEKLEVTKVSDAEEIIKLSLQFQHQNLTPERIDRLYNRRYSLPEKPEQSLDQTDEEYQVALKKWERNVREVEQDIILDAEMMKPELAKHKKELTPKVDSGNAAQAQQGPSQEELAAAQQARAEFLQGINPTLKSFSGYTATVKDQDLEIPVSYVISDEERTALAKTLETFNVEDFIAGRWLTKEGKANTLQIAEDIHLLTNKSSIFAKMANDSAAKRIAEFIKQKSNISVTGASEQTVQEGKKDLQTTLAEMAFGKPK